MNNCLSLRDFVDQMLSEGHSFVVMDLADCSGMDSTFMGLIAGAATYEVQGRPAGVAVVNASDSLVKLIRSVGLNELVYVEQEPFETPDVQFVPLEDQPSEEERLRLVRNAHRNLIRLSDKNEEVFGPLVSALEIEMRQRGLLAD
jgi:anti-anti-sigma regulatory factor